MKDTKVYLGDGVYVADDGPGLILTVEYGEGEPDHTIYLVPEVMEKLIAYWNRRPI